jgi:hypothetical protein
VERYWICALTLPKEEVTLPVGPLLHTSQMFLSLLLRDSSSDSRKRGDALLFRRKLLGV